MISPVHSTRVLDPTAPLQVLLVGAGGRDHALAWKLAQSPRCGALHAAPGNAGIARVGTCHDVAMTDFDGLVELALALQIDLVVIGAEDLLIAGLADRFLAAGVPTLGPTAEAARIEGSKVFAKGMMNQLGIPTPPWASYTDVKAARAAIDAADFAGDAGVAVKADGLAAGRGAFVCQTRDEAHAAIEALMVDEVFGASGNEVLIESLIAGNEVSVMVATDGRHMVSLPSARDYKRLGDGDTGPNTGGMGAHAPCDDTSSDELHELAELAVRPIIDELARRGTPFRGVMYAGVMRTADGPQVLEYNCRFGNPETQALVRVMDVDLLDLLARAATGTLDAATPAVQAQGAAVAVCVASANYPQLEVEREPFLAHGLQAAETSGTGAPGSVVVFTGFGHDEPGTTDTLRAAGGRVATVTAQAATLDEARALAYFAVATIDVPGAQVRADIGLTESQCAAIVTGP